MAARGVNPAGRGTSPSRRHDAGSHSVDRIVSYYIYGVQNRFGGAVCPTLT
jgi:hypothetical protein